MSKKVKLPKEIGGVKVPKPWRKAAEAAIEQAASPAGLEVAAAALTAAAAALAGKAVAEAARAPDGPPPRPFDAAALMGLAATAIGRLRAAGEGNDPSSRP